ncbi:hypothetical protein D3C73_1403630 [compost metagenome]
MQIGKQNQPLAEIAVLFRQRFFHFYNHVRLAPHFRSGLRYCCTLIQILAIHKATARTSPLLNKHLMACFAECFNSGWRDRYTVLVVLDFFGHADNHVIASLM